MAISTHNIQAKSHILTLLGEELIGSDSLAIFELVKNAYDADADNINVTFVDLNTPNQKIVIEDDGHGMSPDTIKNVWLTIGTDFKRGNKRKPSKKYGRISLGNKGVGRLAVHKLAREITVETQVKGDLFSSRFSIDWGKLIKSKEYIQELTVDVESIGETLFKKGSGTRIILTDLTTKKWTKPILRELVRKIEN
ncbi:MAG: ATP-binding protein, partial [Bacteroidetes bacterium]|nr:ATP-binding protein [Bacteroidota bacterium]